MKQLNHEETKRLLKLWEEHGHEDVFLFEVTENYKFVVKATTETDNTNGGLRVLAYDQGNGWQLENHHVERLMSEHFYNVLNDMHGEHCGGIYFYNETEEEREPYETVYDCMWQFSTTKDAPIVLDMQQAEFSQLFDLLRPGCYMIHLSDSNGNIEIGGAELC